MHWNYRVVEYHNGCGHEVMEVYYDEDGKVIGMCRPMALAAIFNDHDHFDPHKFDSSDPDPVKTITEGLQRIINDITNPNTPIFKEPKEWAKDPNLSKKAVLRNRLLELVEVSDGSEDEKKKLKNEWVDKVINS